MGEEKKEEKEKEKEENKKLDEGEEEKQDKMEENEDTKSLLGADKAEHETFYNDQIFRQLFLGFEVRSEEGRWVDPEFKKEKKMKTKKKEDTSREVEAGTEEEVQPL